MLRKRLQDFDPIVAVTVFLVVASLVALALTFSATPADAAGGIAADGSSGKPGKAKLKKNGIAVPPANAPKRVVKAIEAANEIHRKPYVWGGGHGSFKDNGYDCSGAVSYMLRGAKMLKTPMDSGSLASWGRKGNGDWISVYANSGHVYAVVAGLRWDTSMTPGDGPGWSKEMRSSRGFAKRHYKNF